VKATGVLMVMAVASMACCSCSTLGIERIVGSGTPATREVDVRDFRTVALSGALQGEITRAESFRVSLTADDNILEHIKVHKDGPTLIVCVGDPGPRLSVSPRTPMKVQITMPALHDLTLSGACTAAIGGVQGGRSFRADLSGASTLQGDVSADKMTLAAIGASTATLRGTAQEAALSASGASQLRLGELSVARADVDLSGASAATVHVREHLDYTLSGASQLKYAGHPTLGHTSASGASSASAR
jgi:serine/threonine-protein kinase